MTIITLLLPQQQQTHVSSTNAHIHIVRMIQLGNKVPTAKYFIIRPHIGVKWSFDVRGGALHPREMLYVTGGRTCATVCLPDVVCQMLLFVAVHSLRECFSSMFCSGGWDLAICIQYD